ncbi:hypothetical protein ACTA71_011825 [Dictyostelium dimigraforme]
MYLSFFLKITLIFAIFCFVNSTITDYTFAIGHDLNSPIDIPRTSVPLLTSPLQEELGQTSGGVYNATLSRFYLNNIVSLSSTNQFGAVAHYNNLNDLFIKMNNITKVNLNRAVSDINTLSKFSVLTSSVTNQTLKYWSNAQLNFENFQTLITQLTNSITQTKNNLVVNSPNSDIYNVVLRNYEITIQGLVYLNQTFDNIKGSFDITLSSIMIMDNSNKKYEANSKTDDLHQSDLITGMNNFLISLNTFYIKSYLLSRLI